MCMALNEVRLLTSMCYVFPQLKCTLQAIEMAVLLNSQFNEWSKENVKTRTARSRTGEDKRYDQ
ncbi:Uncharacterized protein TSPI_09642 [Trichinella spiralis]|uniref:Uncharacterized protein n=1 Tax=Trichinella spiralis TaxID=6334 RepID=A0ABR3L2F3_TRISP